MGARRLSPPSGATKEATLATMPAPVGDATVRVPHSPWAPIEIDTEMVTTGTVPDAGIRVVASRRTARPSASSSIVGVKGTPPKVGWAVLTFLLALLF